MVRAVVKNTFVVLQPEDDEMDLPVCCRPSRSKSADVVRRKPSEAHDEESVYSLNRILRMGASAAPPTDAAKAPSVDELRELQRRLSKLIGQKLLADTDPCTSSDHASMRSLSTSAADEETAPSESPSKLLQTRSWCSMSAMTSESEEETGLAGAEHVGGDSDSQAAPPSAEFPHPRSGRSHKRLNLAEEFSRSNQQVPITTVMIRNMPKRYSQQELIHEVDGLGFKGSYDFVYMPVEKCGKNNVGYAFINFVDEAWARRCMQAFEGYCFKRLQKAGGCSNKLAAASIAHVQGLEANVRHYENMAVNTVLRSKCQPGPTLVASIADRVEQCQLRGSPSQVGGH